MDSGFPFRVNSGQIITFSRQFLTIPGSYFSDPDSIITISKGLTQFSQRLAWVCFRIARPSAPAERVCFILWKDNRSKLRFHFLKY